MNRYQPLYPNHTYHIYGRGVNGTTIFSETRNYVYFLELYAHYIAPIARTYAYCLLSNHYHFLLQIRPNPDRFDQARWLAHISLQFRTFLSTYTKAYNKAFDRSGGLFEKPFKRKRVHDDSYFTQLIMYIHQNPQKHGYVKDFSVWKFSSYRAILSHRPTQVERHEVLGWFGGSNGFIESHLLEADEFRIAELITNDMR